MIVIVAAGDPFIGDGTVIRCTGTSEDGTKRVTFAGDHRVMLGLMDLVQVEGEVPCEVEPWQVLLTEKVPA
jgi:hypothetical protein